MITTYMSSFSATFGDCFSFDFDMFKCCLIIGWNFSCQWKHVKSNRQKMFQRIDRTSNWTVDAHTFSFTCDWRSRDFEIRFSSLLAIESRTRKWKTQTHKKAVSFFYSLRFAGTSKSISMWFTMNSIGFSSTRAGKNLFTRNFWYEQTKQIFVLLLLLPF